MRFIKISINEKIEQIINIDSIYQLVKDEDYRGEVKFIPSYNLILKNCGPIQISENVYNQIKEKLKDLTL